MATPAMIAIVIRAFLASGGLNVGVPLAIVSTPVSADAPEEKARSTSQMVRPCVATISSAGGPASVNDPGESPMSTRTKPTATVLPIATMKKYVGAAKIDPDSRTPRRLPSVKKMTKKTAIGTR